jgi:hypothetical protein
MLKSIHAGLVAAALLLLADAAASAPPSSLAGVYKHRFENGDVTGRKYMSEDILEIVPVGPDAMYFREHRNFFNGHTCGINGIAHSQAGEFVYRSRDPAPAYAGGPTCVIHLRREGPVVYAGDVDGGCAAFCGARGSLRGSSFPFSARRPIRYLPRLKASREFKAAIAEDAER